MLARKILHQTSRCIRSLATFTKESNRFYKEVDVVQTDEGYTVKLDKYNVRTPLRNVLVLPTEKLADAVAIEWDSQKKSIIFALMPLSTLCFKATDKPISNSDLIEHMLDFLTTDTVCYRAPASDDQLHSLEINRWNPITEWFSRYYHVHLALTTDITLTPQSDQTIQRLREHLSTLHPWTLPAYHHSTTSLKSLVIAMAMLDGGLAVEEAIACSCLESDYQIDRWGEVEWQHTLDRARLTADVAAAVLVAQEVKSLSVEKSKAINWN